MSVIGLLVILCLLGLAAWFVNYKIPISPTFKTIINIVLVVIAIIICLVAFGVWDDAKSIKVPKI